MRIGYSLKRVLGVSKAHETGTVMVADSIEPAEPACFEQVSGSAIGIGSNICGRPGWAVEIKNIFAVGFFVRA
ncbi:hypothetical protein [Pseudomonas sp. LP_7_YM]|uniref:hypothetical protein n=1 Tax=Pseudomonas sp. LP_7_YM TaxID=2485137 RepID=UPI00105BC551|nr:hypothetical protein [Pseudomonas sp. LP_7_YM]TDV72118.1 hypothetical protein EC915_101258 [Pseudomonas sp. LP_7_YM]